MEHWLILIGGAGAALFFGRVLAEIVIVFSEDERDGRFWAIVILLGSMTLFMTLGAVAAAVELVGLPSIMDGRLGWSALLIMFTGMGVFFGWMACNNLMTGVAHGRDFNRRPEKYHHRARPVSYWMLTGSAILTAAGCLAADIAIIASALGLLE